MQKDVELHFHPDTILVRSIKSVMITITINGTETEIANGTTVADLLAQREQNPRYLAVERNRLLVPRAEHAACRLEQGDQLEIVTLVGGG